MDIENGMCVDDLPIEMVVLQSYVRLSKGSK